MIVFTDLDGTLLDHETYRFDAALPALETLAARGVPLVLATSKTAAEIGPIRQALGRDVPAIVENGGGIDWAGDAAVTTIPTSAQRSTRCRRAFVRCSEASATWTKRESPR